MLLIAVNSKPTSCRQTNLSSVIAFGMFAVLWHVLAFLL